jgi:FKBP-type peptidyl-prolyl cis-trans isomerase
MNPLRISALTLLLGGSLIFVPGCGPEDDEEGQELKVDTGRGTTVTMRYKDLVVGKGPALQKFDKVEVHYTGWLASGKKFDSSLDRNEPFPVQIGLGKVIKGWDAGLIGMKVGGKRKLFIPPELGYGAQGSPPTIPPNAKLVFEVELLRIVND